MNQYIMQGPQTEVSISYNKHRGRKSKETAFPLGKWTLTKVKVSLSLGYL